MTQQKDGIYQISNEHYHASEGFSRSQLMWLNKSPYHFWYHVLSGEAEPKKETPGQRIGAAFHAALLEPDLFKREYIAKPTLEKYPPEVRKKDVGEVLFEQYKEQKADIKQQNDLKMHEFQFDSEGKTVLSESEYEQIQAMVAMTKKHKAVTDILDGCQYEQSIYWTDEQTGLLFKCRPDAWSNKLIVDVKTTFTDAQAYKVQRSALDYGFYLQAGMMYEGCKAIGKPIESFVNIVIEKEAPYVPAVFMMTDEALQYGIDQFHKYKFVLAECIEKKRWPAYPVQELSVPGFITKKMENEQ